MKPSAVLYSGVNVPWKILEWFLVQISISGDRGTSACSLGVTKLLLAYLIPSLLLVKRATLLHCGNSSCKIYLVELSCQNQQNAAAQVC